MADLPEDAREADPGSLERAEQLYRDGRHRDALAMARAVVERVHGAERLQAEVLVVLSLNRTGRPDPDGAQEVHGRAKGTPAEAAAAFAVGEALFGMRQLEASERWLAGAVRLAHEAGEEAVAWRAQAHVAMCRAQCQDLDTATRLIGEAAAGLREAGDRREAALRFMGHANLKLWKGRMEEAAGSFAAAEACAVGFPDVLADVLRSRSRLARQVGSSSERRALLERARDLLADRGGLALARVLNDLGDAARAEGRPDEAREHLLASLEARKGRDESVTRLNLALLEIERGDRTAARAFLEPLLTRPENPWYQLFAHGVAVAAAEDEATLDAHLDALDASGTYGTYAERDMLDVFRRALQTWRLRDADRAARIAAHFYGQARSLDLARDEAEAQLIALRAEGAAVPLGPLSLDREVGSGGMGQVWRGRVRGTHLTVAVKVLAKERAHDPSVRAALARELRAVARLDHPHIVPLVDHGEMPPAIDVMTGGRLPAGTPWLATRWAAAGTLADWRGRRPYREVREALLQLLQALAAAHAEGLLHLDVKPANILVSEEAPLVTWLADFGVARALGGDPSQPVAGTPAFMAPEQCRGAFLHYGPWTDLYAVGGTAVALVQGHPPFEGRSRSLMQQHLTRPVPPIQPLIPVPDGFDGWCRRLLAKDPAHRFPCAADAAAVLVALGDAPDGPRSSSSAPLGPPPSSSSTFLLDALGEPGPEVGGQPAPSAPVAPMPEAPPEPQIRVAPPALAWAASHVLPLRRVPIVGWERERRALWAALRRARLGAHLIRLEAASGGVRNQLLRWLAMTATRSGAARTLWLDRGDTDPWRACLRRLLQVEGLAADAIERALPRLLNLHQGLDDLGPTERGYLARVLTSAEAGVAESMAVTLRVVAALSRARPVLVCVATDHEHAPSFVSRLLELLAEHPVLVAGPAEATPSGPRGDALPVAPMTAVELASLLDALVPLDPALREDLIRASDGGPALAVWTVRGWLADRQLVPTPAGLTVRDASLPDSLDEAFRRVLDPVLLADAGHRRRAQLAAALGARFTREDWQRACEADGVGDSAELADNLVERGVLRETRAGYRFARSGLRRRILAATTEAQRADLHRILADALDDDDRSAAHRMAAGDAAGALTPLRRLMLRAAVGRRGDGQELIGRWRDAATDADLPPDHPELLRGTLASWLLGDPPEPSAIAQALDALGAAADPAAVTWARLAEVRSYRSRGDLDAARRAAEAAEAALQAADTPDLRRLALRDAGLARLAAGGDAALLEEAASQGDAVACVALVGTLLEAGRPAEALRWSEVAQPAQDLGPLWASVERLQLAAASADALGRSGIAARRREEAIALGRAAGLPLEGGGGR